MRLMSDTELRIVLVVTRATLGWELDSETGMRKQEDWLSHYQLKERTGRGSASISAAIASCIKKEWIEARDISGKILDTKAKRAGKRIFYRLGKIFLDKVKTSSESEEVTPTSSESEISESEDYKRNTYTKDNTTTKVVVGKRVSYGNQEINELHDFLKATLKLEQLDGSIKANRYFANHLLKKFKTAEAVKEIISAAANDEFWSKQITGFKGLFYNAMKVLKSKKTSSNLLKPQPEKYEKYK